MPNFTINTIIYILDKKILTIKQDPWTHDYIIFYQLNNLEEPNKIKK